MIGGLVLGIGIGLMLVFATAIAAYQIYFEDNNDAN
jgi:hypothetical protein